MINIKNNDQKSKSKQAQISVNLDTTPILYTDNINMMSGTEGIVLDVTQRLGATDQVRIVARIGMSRKHAKKLVESLGKLLSKPTGKVITGKKIIN